MVQGWADRTPRRLHDARQGVRPDDAASGEARGPAGGPARRDAGRRARPGRPAAARAPRRGVPPLPRRASSRCAATGKLGGILFQFPSYVVFKDASLDYLEWAREQLGSDEMLVEFRHRSWLDEDNRAETLSFLERIGAAYVTVDAPQSDTAKNLVPTVPAVTARHARTSASTDATSARGTSAAARRRSASTTSTPTRSSPSGRGTLKELAGAVEAGVRVLQQQRDVGGSGEPARPHLAGGDERAPAADAARPQRRPGDRRDGA